MLSEYFSFRAYAKHIYSLIMNPVCEKYGLKRTELDILLFLANNPQYDTAADIVEQRLPVKSHVSSSLRTLEERGFISKSYKNGNRKTSHIKLCPSADAIISEGRNAHKEFSAVLTDGIPENDKRVIKNVLKKISENSEKYLKEIEEK